MEPRELHLRIFLALPGDVANERMLARNVVDQLRYNPEWRGRVTLELIAWDNPGAVAMLATAMPQASVAHQLPKPSECDIVVVILWSRIELLWRFIKYRWLPFTAYGSYEKLKEVVEEILANFGENTI